MVTGSSEAIVALTGLLQTQNISSGLFARFPTQLFLSSGLSSFFINFLTREYPFYPSGFLKFMFDWRIIALHCCVGFCLPHNNVKQP